MANRKSIPIPSCKNLFQQFPGFSTKNQAKPGAKFSKLLRKIFERLLFQRKYVDFRNFVGNFLGRI